MKNNETGEFELVLGNRQLLSGFFIVVILFAVFFVMGYIVGRNSTPATQLAANRDQNSGAAAPSNTRPQPASGTAPAPQNPPAAAAEPPKEDAGGNAPASGQPATQAAQPPAAKTELPPPANPAVPAPAKRLSHRCGGPAIERRRGQIQRLRLGAGAGSGCACRGQQKRSPHPGRSADRSEE